MIVLDTNIVSAVMARTPVKAVLEWLDQRDTGDQFLTSITIAEIGYGLHILPAGKRRRSLEQSFENFVARGFHQRVLDFDTLAAREYAEVMGHRRRIGRPMSILDGQIAAIARSRRFALATRNVRDFEECGIEIMNPCDPR